MENDFKNALPFVVFDQTREEKIKSVSANLQRWERELEQAARLLVSGICVNTLLTSVCVKKAQKEIKDVEVFAARLSVNTKQLPATLQSKIAALAKGDGKGAAAQPDGAAAGPGANAEPSAAAARGNTFERIGGGGKRKLPSSLLTI